MEQAIAFLSALQQNNNREWFHAHKTEYQAVQARFNAFTDELIQRIAAFDDTVAGLTAKECVYRIYRDTRFSQDKSPYKTHLGAFIVPGGKKSGFGGYYFQVGPGENGFDDSTILATGNYYYEPAVLKVLREDICNGEGDFDRVVKQAAPFCLDRSDALKRNPTGFPADAPYPEYLRLRSYCLVYQPEKPFVRSASLLDELTALFRATQPFLHYVNRAIAFSRE